MHLLLLGVLLFIAILVANQKLLQKNPKALLSHIPQIVAALAISGAAGLAVSGRLGLAIPLALLGYYLIGRNQFSWVWKLGTKPGAAGSSSGKANNGRPVGAGITVREAYEVLGLSPGASRDEIQAAHRNLMKRYHPDHGGTTYLASKINEAKDVLLG